ncbi:MAG: alpha/beta hydrolase [Candidatus Thermoplasmatota archaeon]|nr:alpha/beta hydrolase [Candidatus Thermoplasmatota archaeon]
MVQGKVDVDGGNLYYEVSGKGLPVVLIHAGFLDSRMWDTQFEQFSEDFKIIRYDVRGFGKSTLPGARYSDAEDLKTLLDRLEIADAVFLGVSNGGRICLDFAVEYPDRVRGLVLVDFGIRGYESTGPEEDKLWDFSAEMEKRYSELITKGEYMQAAALDVDIWSPLLSGEVRERILSIATDNAIKQANYKENFQVSPDPPAFGRLKILRMPILMILGKKDVPGQAAVVSRVHELIPGSELVTIDDADHVPSLSSPATFNRLVLQFLERLKNTVA